MTAIILTVFLLLDTLFLSYGALPSQEIGALFNFFNATNGPDWNWKDESRFGPMWNFDEIKDPCNDNGVTWQGVTCSLLPTFCRTRTCHVTKLSLPAFSLEGRVPTNLQSLTALTYINFRRNILSGELSPLFLQFPLIQHLDLNTNRFAATIPSSLSNVKSLTYLDLKSNILSGTIPSELYTSLSKLQIIYLSLNFLSSTISSSIIHLSALKEIRFDFNAFSHSIPFQLWLLSSLEYIDLEGNLFTSIEKIPEYSMVKSTSTPSGVSDLLSLQHVAISGITGMASPQDTPQDTPSSSYQSTAYTYPCQLSLLTFLTLRNNLISANLTEWLNATSRCMFGLESLNIEENFFTGVIPSSVGDMTALQLFDIAVNEITGSIPDTIGQLSGLQVLRVFHNEFTGTLPSSLWTLTSLRLLDVVFSCLSGSLPEQIGRLQELQALYLTYNKFTGTLPSALYTLTKLSNIDLRTNFLSGTLSSSIGNVTLVRDLELGNNLFSGSLPVTLGFLGRVRNLFLYLNAFSGPIPDLSNFTLCKFFTISRNMFTGNIPSYISTFIILRQLELDNNFLTNTIPSEFGDFRRVYLITIGSNMLNGTIPKGIARLIYTNLLDVSNNMLTGNLDGLFEFNISSILAMLNQSDTVIDRNISLGDDNSIVPDNLMNKTYSINYLYLQQNKFTGTLPENVGYAKYLRHLFLFNNLLSGTLPSNLSQCSLLETFLIQDNNFIGYSDAVFVNLTSLVTLDISNNLFSGVFPNFLFQLPLLGYISIVQNCFNGDIGNEICEAKQLKTVILEGLKSGKNCRLTVWDPFHLSNSYLASTTFSNFIPDCVWTMTQLEVLHLSGNLFSGTIPNMVQLPKLKSLSISHNRLYGTVPIALQSLVFGSYPPASDEASTLSYSGAVQQPWLSHTLPSHSSSLDLFAYGRHVSSSAYRTSASTSASGLSAGGITEFDVSHNKFSGEWKVDTYIYEEGNENSKELTLSVNRLSGKIPASFLSIANIDILVGNVFKCNDRSDLPSSDPEYATYVCGSDDYDSSLQVYLVCLISIIFIAILPFLLLANYYNNQQIRDNDNEDVKFSNNSTGISFMQSVATSIKACIKRIMTCLFLNERVKQSVVTLQLWYNTVNLVDTTSINDISSNGLNTENLRVMYPNLIKFILTLKKLRYLSSVLSVVVCVTYGGIYVISKERYNATTHLHEYRWLYTSAYLSGSGVTIVMYISLTVICVYFMWLVNNFDTETNLHINPSDINDNAATSDRSHHYHHRSSSITDEDPLDCSSNFPSFSSFVSFSSHSPSQLQHTANGSNDPVNVIYGERKPGNSDRLNVKTTPHVIVIGRYLLTFAIMAFNISLILVVKGFFVYVSTQNKISSSQQILYQFALSCYDVIWSKVLATLLFLKFSSSYLHSTTRVRLYLFLILFNSIIAPLLCISFTHRNCFSYLFFDTLDPIATDVVYQYCDFLASNGGTLATCTEFNTIKLTTSFDPPFTYSFQCTSSLLTVFLPSFVFTYILIGLVLPLFHLLVLGIVSSWKTNSTSIVTSSDSTSFLSRYAVGGHFEYYLNRNVTNPKLLISILLHHMIVMLTFGISSPILAAIIGGAMLFMITVQIVGFGRCISIAIASSTSIDNNNNHNNNNSNDLDGDHIGGGVEHPTSTAKVTRASEWEQRRSSVDVSTSPFQSLSSSQSHSHRLLANIDKACIDVSCAPRNALFLIIDSSFIFMSLMCLDIAGDEIGNEQSLYQYVVGLLCVPIGLRLGRKLYLVYKSNVTGPTPNASFSTNSTSYSNTVHTVHTAHSNKSTHANDSTISPAGSTPLGYLARSLPVLHADDDERDGTNSDAKRNKSVIEMSYARMSLSRAQQQQLLHDEMVLSPLNSLSSEI